MHLSGATARLCCAALRPVAEASALSSEAIVETSAASSRRRAPPARTAGGRPWSSAEAAGSGASAPRGRAARRAAAGYPRSTAERRLRAARQRRTAKSSSSTAPTGSCGPRARRSGERRCRRANGGKPTRSSPAIPTRKASADGAFQNSRWAKPGRCVMTASTILDGLPRSVMSAYSPSRRRIGTIWPASSRTRGGRSRCSICSAIPDLPRWSRRRPGRK